MEQNKGILSYSLTTIAVLFVSFGIVNSLSFLSGSEGGAVHWKSQIWCGALISACLLYVLGTRVTHREHSRNFRILCEILKTVMLFTVLAGAVYVRIEAIRTFTLQPEQQDRMTYTIARYLQNGMIQERGSRYCDYLSQNPYYFGYSWLLSLAFKFLGSYVSSGQYLNILFSVLGLICLYGCGKKLGGFWYGLAAMTLAAFWPAQILQIVVLSSTTVFSAILLLALYLYLSATQKEYGQQEGAAADIVRFLFLGVVTAISCVLHPAGWIFSTVIFLAVCMQRKKLPPLPLNDIPLTRRFVARGYRPALLMGLAMLLTMTIFNTHVELAINRDVVSSWTCANKYLYSDFAMYEGNTDGMIAEPYMEQLAQSLGSDGQLYQQLQDAFREQKEATAVQIQFLRRAESAARVFYPVLLVFGLLSLLQSLMGVKQVDVVFIWSLLATLIIALFPGITQPIGQLQFAVVLLQAVGGAYGLFHSKRRKAKIRNMQLLSHMEENPETKVIHEDIVKLPKTEEALNFFDLEKEVREGHIVMTMTEASEKEYLADKKRKKENQ